MVQIARRLAGVWLATLILAGLGAASPARAVTCVATASNIAFGSLNIAALNGATTTGTIFEGCTGGWPTAGNLATCNAIGAGSNSVSQANRTMTFGANSIAYQLYSDAFVTPYAYPGSDKFFIPYTTASGGHTTTTTSAKIISFLPSIPPGTYTDTYTTAAQSFVDFNTFNTQFPPIICGTNGFYTGLATNFTVSVTLLPSCSVSATTLNFGIVGVLTANIDASANLSVTCTITAPYTVSLSAGASPGATTANRAMTGPGGKVKYALYQDPGRTTNWGNNIGVDTVAGTGTGAAQSIPVYGRVAPQATPPVGTYTDTVVITVSF
jgi:spore coat protein U-like protein